MILIFVATMCMLIAWWAHRRRYCRSTYNLPRVSGQLPLLGIAHQLYGDNRHFWEIIKRYSTQANNNEGILTAWLGPTVFCFVLTDPEMCFKLSNMCLDKLDMYKWGKGFIGDGLITSNANVWRVHRKLLNPAFNQNVLNGFLQIFNQQSSQLVKTFSEHADGKQFDPRQYVSNNALETICQTAMGLPKDEISIVNKTYLKAIDKLLQIYTQRVRNLWQHPSIIYNMTSMKREEDTLIKILQDVSISVLRRSKESILHEKKLSSTGEKFKPFVKLLLEMSDDGRLSDKEIRDEVDTMISAGYETTVNTVVIALIIIGSSAEIQEKVFKELHETFGDTDRDVTKDDLSKLVYMDAVIKECLRCYPVVPIIGRKVDKDINIDNKIFPKGSQLFISVWGINHHPCWGANRNEFVPDRWLSPETLPSNPNAFAAFSLGKRTCLGKSHAMMSLKVTLSHILRKYRVKADLTKLELSLEITVKPTGGSHISLERR